MSTETTETTGAATPTTDFARPVPRLKARYNDAIATELVTEFGHANVNQVAMGTGPFMFVEYVPNTRIVLERNPTWWGEPPAFERVVVRVIENTAALEANLLSGAIDYIAGEVGLTVDQALAFESRHGDRFDILYKPVLFYGIEAMAKAGIRQIGIIIAPETGDEIRETGKATRAYLGVRASTAAAGQNTEVGNGAEVVSVEPDSAAEDAGIAPGDVVTAVGDRPVTSSTELTAAVRSTLSATLRSRSRS